jgi:hypothetical protein
MPLVFTMSEVCPEHARVSLAGIRDKDALHKHLKEDFGFPDFYKSIAASAGRPSALP